MRERLTSADDKTSTKSTTDGNHSNVTSLETTVKHGLGRSLETANLNILIALVAEAALLSIIPVAGAAFARTGVNTVRRIHRVMDILARRYVMMCFVGD